MSEKTWNDQPNELTCATLLGSFTFEPNDSRRNASRSQVELRSAPYLDSHGMPYGNQPKVWYVTVGNLFGSQTVKCKSAEVVLNVLCNMGKDVKMPGGAELMENTK